MTKIKIFNKKKKILKPIKKISIDSYFTDVIRFVKSLVFKIDESYINFNYHRYAKYGANVKDRIDSKYYINLAGKLAPGVKPVIVNSPLANKDIPLTRDLLNTDFLLKNNLSKYDTIYDKLILNNPTMHTYVQGCFLNLDITDIINAKNHKLLYANKKFLNEREYSLLNDVEIFFNKMFHRWFNPRMMIDELYLPSFLNNVYQGLVIYVLTKKIQNTFTHKVDEFHMFHYLNSYKNIATYLEVFDDETKLWLYGNLKRLKKYIGHNSTLEDLLFNVYDKNKYGVGNITYRKRKPEFIEDNVNSYNKEYFNRKYEYEADAVNKSFFDLKDAKYNFTELEHMLKENEAIPDFYRLNKKITDTLSKYNKMFESRTKNFLLDKPEKMKQFYYNKVTLVISNFLMLLKNNNFSLNTFDYLNPYNNTIYKLTGKDLYNIILYTLSKYINVTENKYNLILEGVFDYPDKNKVLNNTWHKELLNVDIFNFLYPKELTIKTFPDYNLVSFWFSYLDKIEEKAYYLITNLVDLSLRNDIILMINNGFHREIINVDLENIKTYLEKRNLIDFLPFNNINYSIKKLKDLLKSLTGVDLNPEKLILEMYNDLKHFFTKTTSYSVILLTDFNFKDVWISNNLKPSINLDYKPFIDEKDGEWKRSNELPVDIYGMGYEDAKPQYYDSHYSSMTTLINTDKNFLMVEQDRLKNKSTPNTIIYARRFGVKYKVESDTEFIKNNPPIETVAIDKSIDIDIINKPMFNNNYIPDFILNRNNSVLYPLGKYTNKYIITNRPGTFIPEYDVINKTESVTTNFKFTRQDTNAIKIVSNKGINKDNETISIYEPKYPLIYKPTFKNSIALENDTTTYKTENVANTYFNNRANPVLKSNIVYDISDNANETSIILNKGLYINKYVVTNKSSVFVPNNDVINKQNIDISKIKFIGGNNEPIKIDINKINHKTKSLIANTGYLEEYKPSSKAEITLSDNDINTIIKPNQSTLDIIDDPKLNHNYGNNITDFNSSNTYRLGKYTKPYSVILSSTPLTVKDINSNTTFFLDNGEINKIVTPKLTKIVGNTNGGINITKNTITNRENNIVYKNGYNKVYSIKQNKTSVYQNDKITVENIKNALSAIYNDDLGDDKIRHNYTEEIKDLFITDGITTTNGKFDKILKIKNTTNSSDYTEDFNNIKEIKQTLSKINFISNSELITDYESNRVTNTVKPLITNIGYLNEYKLTSVTEHIENNPNVREIPNAKKSTIDIINNPNLNNSYTEEIKSLPISDSITNTDAKYTNKYKVKNTTKNDSYVNNENDKIKKTKEKQSNIKYTTDDTLFTKNTTDNTNNKNNAIVYKEGYGKIYKLKTKTDNLPSDTKITTVPNKNKTNVTPIGKTNTISDTNNVKNDNNKSVTN